MILWQLPQWALSIALLGYFHIFGRIMGKQYVTGSIAGRSCVYCIKGDRKGAFSLGGFIFVYSGYRHGSGLYSEVVRHEYGHAMQSAYLGWLYLPVIGLPSLLVTGISPAFARRCYFERWADRLASKVNMIITGV